MKQEKKKRVAFTLAEVLITLGIIGVVAALTIPTLIRNYQERAWNTASSVFVAKLLVALKTMNVQDSLSGLGTTEAFVSNLSKFMKVTKTCSNSELDKCFDNSITTIKDGESTTISLNDSALHLSTAKDLGHKDWTTNIMGIQFANGTTGLIAYNNHDCNQDSYSNDNGLLSNCVALVYDTSGFSNPNTVSKDIRTFNASKIGTMCGGSIINGKCYAPDIAYTPINCQDSANAQYCGSITGIKYTNDYYAGARKACMDAGMRMISNNDLPLEIPRSPYGNQLVLDETNTNGERMCNVFPGHGIAAYYQKMTTNFSTAYCPWTRDSHANDIRVICVLD